MKKWAFWYKVFKNKYILSVVVFVMWVMFFDRNDFFTQYQRKKELDKLETSQAYYEAEIKKTRKELAELESDQRVLEKFAREKYFLKRANEDVFVVADSAFQKN